MARWYATFDNSTVSALQASTNGNRFQRITYPAVGGGAAARKAALLAARSALSSAVHAQLNDASKIGDFGRCFTQDSFARGVNLTWSNIYQNTAANWSSNPKNRPTAAITIANSTLFAADAGSVPIGLYNDAVAALEQVLADLNMRTHRTPNDFWRMMASLFNGADDNHIGWDDYTPGQPQTLSIDAVTERPPGSAAVSLTGRWATQYPADAEAAVTVRMQVQQITPGSGAGATSYDSGEIALAAGTTSRVFNTTALQGDGSAYDCFFMVRYSYATPFASVGANANLVSESHITFAPIA